MGSSSSLSPQIMSFDKQLNAWSKEELLNAAEEEFGETPKLLKSSLADVKSWLAKSPHLHSICQDDQFLTTFLGGCKYSLERTKEKLDNFHAVKSCTPEWFDNWDPLDPAVQEILNTGLFLPLPGYDKQGRFVTLNLSGKVKPSKMKMEDLLRASMMVMSVARKNDEQAIIRGFVMVQDMDGIGAEHLTMFNLAVIKKMITMGKTAWPVRPKGAHILNRPSIMESIHNMVRNLQEEKMRNRNTVHKAGDLTKLHEDLGQDILPAEYGGTNGTIEELRVYWKNEVEKNRDWLIEQTKYKTDEKKRPGKPKLHSDLFGIEGSFRKLDID